MFRFLHGFVKIQTDIYRVRQLVLNTTDATRLAVSPTLAGIAHAETALASQAQISTFFDKLRNTAATSPQETLPPVAVAATRAGAFNAGFGSNLNDTLAVGNTGFEIGINTGINTGIPLQQLRGTESLGLAFDTGITPIKATYTPIDITNASPVVGSLNLRTLSIVDQHPRRPARRPPALGRLLRGGDPPHPHLPLHRGEGERRRLRGPR